MQVLTRMNVSGRFTLAELSHLIGTLTWTNGVPETRSEDEQAAWDLVRQAKEYLDKTPNAVAVDILQGQIMNVVTKS